MLSVLEQSLKTLWSGVLRPVFKILFPSHEDRLSLLVWVILTTDRASLDVHVDELWETSINLSETKLIVFDCCLSLRISLHKATKKLVEDGRVLNWH